MAMQETPGKDFARRYFYLTFVPSLLPEGILQEGEFLTLLGETEHEMIMLDELGVPRENIYSVERELDVYNDQVERYNGRVKLFRSEAVEFIQSNLESNRKFLVINLDIFGSYLNGIDPAMSTVLLFARRNPRTAIATYSNVGRDADQLREGLKSLFLFLWYAPEATEEMMAKLVGFYQQAGLSERVSWNMGLRHCFWLRSHMEHTAASAHAVGRVEATAVSNMLSDHENAWRRAARRASKQLRYGELRQLAMDIDAPSAGEGLLDVGLSQFKLITYAASSNFYHNNYFALYSSLPRLMTPGEWLKEMAEQFVEEPPIFIDDEGERKVFSGEPAELSESARVWHGGPLRRQTRRVAIPPQSEQLAMTTVELGASFPLDRRTVAKIYRLIERGYATTKEILPHLPPGSDPRRVTAHIATARRGTRRR